MEITKFGEAYKIFDSQQEFDISGDLVKVTDGNVVISVSTNAPGNTDDHFGLYTGTYNAEGDSLNMKIDTKISKYSEYTDVMNILLDAINQILNEDSEL